MQQHEVPGLPEESYGCVFSLSNLRPSHQPLSAHTAQTPAPNNAPCAGFMPPAFNASCTWATTASEKRYTVTSMKFFALYLVSVSRRLQSISRPGRMNAYSPHRR